MYMHTCMYVYIYVSRSTCDHRSFSGAPQTGPPGTYYNSQLGAWIRKSGVAGIRMHEASLSQGWASRGALLLPKLQSIRLTVCVCVRVHAWLWRLYVFVACTHTFILLARWILQQTSYTHARHTHTCMHTAWCPRAPGSPWNRPRQLFNFCKFDLFSNFFSSPTPTCMPCNAALLQSSPTTIDLGPIFRGKSPSLQPACAAPVFASTSAPFHKFFLHVQPMDSWSVISQISKLNRFSISSRLFCHVPLERDQMH